MSITESYVGSPGNHAGATFDLLLELIPAGTAFTATGKSKVLYIGAGLVDAELVLDVQNITAGDSIGIQFSEDEAFTTPVAFVYVHPEMGRNIFPFRNTCCGTHKPYAYMRLLGVAGSGTITLAAHIAKK